MAIRLQQVPKRSAGKLDSVAINGTTWLDGDLFTGTPTATEQTTTDLTITNVIVNTSTLTVLGDTVAVGAGLQYNVDGGTEGITYDVLIEGVTQAGREFGFIHSHVCV